MKINKRKIKMYIRRNKDQLPERVFVWFIALSTLYLIYVFVRILFQK